MLIVACSRAFYLRVVDEIEELLTIKTRIEIVPSYLGSTNYIHKM